MSPNSIILIILFLFVLLVVYRQMNVDSFVPAVALVTPIADAYRPHTDEPKRVKFNDVRYERYFNKNDYAGQFVGEEIAPAANSITGGFSTQSSAPVMLGM
jgi:hypothetical protein